MNDEVKARSYPVTRVPGARVLVPDVGTKDSIVWIRWPNGRTDAAYRNNIISERELAQLRSVQ